MEGWKPQKGGNHGRVETMGGWKPQEGGNHERVETIGRWKPQEGGNHTRVETTETSNSGYRNNTKRKLLQKMK